MNVCPNGRPQSASVTDCAHQPQTTRSFEGAYRALKCLGPELLPSEVLDSKQVTVYVDVASQSIVVPGIGPVS